MVSLLINGYHPSLILLFYLKHPLNTSVISNFYLSKTTIPPMAMAAPMSLCQAKGVLSTPNNPNSSIPYATMICDMTINRAVCAGPRLAMLRITVYVIRAPMIPPSSTY